MSQVDEVRAAADIVKIVGDYVKLRKAGVNMVGLCPFHQEKTPSFAVHPQKQIFHCFGCGVGGDVFKFVMLIENLTFPEALRRLAEKSGVVLRESYSDETLDASARERTTLFKIHETAAQFFARQLSGTGEGRAARAYLADRGLTEEVIARFRLGYAPSEGTALTRTLREAGFELEALEKSGLVLRNAEQNRHFDRFRRRVIFPIARESGKIVAFGGRALGDDMPKYLNSPETPIYSKSRMLYNLDRAAPSIRKQDSAILVEGYMDCIAVASSGVENVVASCGTSLTESQVRLLARSSRRVVVNYDPDSAGMAATERSLNLLLEDGCEARVLALPDGLDPDAFVRRRGAQAYRERLQAAPMYLDYLTERAAARHDLRTPEGKVAAANAVMPYLAKVPNPMLRSELANRLAERLKLDEKLLRDELKRAAQEARGELAVRPEAAAIKVTPAEKHLLRAFLENEELLDEFLPEFLTGGTGQGLGTEGIFRRLLEARRQNERIEISQWAESCADEERKLIFEVLLAGGEAPDRDVVLRSLRALEIRKAERDRDRLMTEIKAAAQAQDQARLAELMKAKSNLDKQLGELAKG